MAYTVNLGTLLRTCDAVGACIAVPRTPHYRQALEVGDTLPRRPHLHQVSPDPVRWIAAQRASGRRIVAVEQAEMSTPLPMLGPAHASTVVLLGHEHNGVPDEALRLVDDCIEIPMAGVGVSLNVAVAGSLVLYRLAAMG